MTHVRTCISICMLQLNGSRAQVTTVLGSLTKAARWRMSALMLLSPSPPIAYETLSADQATDSPRSSTLRAMPAATG